MATRDGEAALSAAKARAEANFRKEERERDGAKAMLEYQANAREVREQMARLRALRLAKEAAGNAAGEAAAAPAKAARKARKAAR